MSVADERRVRRPAMDSGIEMLVKYDGAEPCSDLHTNTAILNRTRSATRIAIVETSVHR
jgi:hypothetical protein